MKKGFTILELLVASLLLGMLITILTMIFNQSSIAWRTGVAGVADLDDVRNNIAEVREEADSAYVWDDKIHRVIGLWDESGNLRTRAWDVGTEETPANQALFLTAKNSALKNENSTFRDFKIVPVGSATANNLKTYTINVKSAGPNKVFGDYDDIWSFPDDFEE
ncbi:MAG: prepilin-type N-terminal cleavage/methylation domain-containing protein [Kiritimatiellae bacterium]|nr:prepilin-type N-terminal cleavage/methylation domain-containing protein [Kiritimatiellia bacterium]